MPERYRTLVLLATFTSLCFGELAAEHRTFLDGVLAGALDAAGVPDALRRSKPHAVLSVSVLGGDRLGSASRGPFQCNASMDPAV